VSTLLNQPIKISIELANFKSLGIEISYQDLESVVKRIREKDENINKLMDMLGLEPESFGE
jgi:hypothetical protein